MTPFDIRLPIIAAEARVKTPHVLHTFLAMREMGAKFHIAAFAQFAGLTEAHVEAICAALEHHNCLPEGRAKVQHRATRLPSDWEAPNDWLEWAIDARMWQPHEAREEAEMFANFWQAKAGKDACKLDWRKTWQNWVRNSRRPNGTYRAPVAADGPAHREHLERTAGIYDRMGRTSEAEEIRRELARTTNVVQLRQNGA